MLGELTFAALLAYSPYGQSDVSIRSRRVRDNVKAARPRTLATATKRIREHMLPATEFAPFFGEAVGLVPTPRSAPLREGALWPALEICNALHDADLARSVLTCLERVKAVPKSAYARMGERPTVAQHYDTLQVSKQLDAPQTLVVVDDFVTKGRTMLAAASRVAEAYPGCHVLGFALVRTKGLQPDIDRILEPCHGTLTYQEGDVDREP